MSRPIDAEKIEYYSDETGNEIAYKVDIDELPTLTPQNEWVSVEERLPEKKQDVLMFFKSGNMAVGWWYDVDEHITFWCAYTDDGFYTDCDDIPTHWMPLPAPPDKENNVPTKEQNEPLTIEQLREMDGEAIYWPKNKMWLIVCLNHPDFGDCAVNRAGQYLPLEKCEQRKVYRRPPERQEDTNA